MLDIGRTIGGAGNSQGPAHWNDDAQEILDSARAYLKSQETSLEIIPAHVVPRELLLHTWGHGWEESHLIGDDEDPESFILTECVWINGHIMDENGSDAHADSDHWKENYNRKYGVRVWCGDDEPTKEQREAIQWQG